LFVGFYNYLFDEQGQLQAMQPLSQPVVEAVVKARFPENPGAAMAGYVKHVYDDPKGTQEEPT
jgi:hypothetical protein